MAENMRKTRIKSMLRSQNLSIIIFIDIIKYVNIKVFALKHCNNLSVWLWNVVILHQRRSK